MGLQMNRVMIDASICLAIAAPLATLAFASWRRAKGHAEHLRREQCIRDEFTAYALLDASLPPGGDPRDLAKTVCRIIVEKSFFRHAAMIVRSAEGRLSVAGSAGFDDNSLVQLNAWGERVVRDELGSLGGRAGAKSFPVALGPRRGPLADAAPPPAIIVPIRTQIGRMTGALALIPDQPMHAWPDRVEQVMQPLESFAVKLGRALENSALAQRLLRAEKLVGLGQLAGGVAHELNNPLTAVLGYSELIAMTTADTAIQKQAETIHTEALRMRGIIQALLRFWRPAPQADEPVDLPSLLRELTAKCAPELDGRGVRLLVQPGEGAPPVRGDREQLREVLEHLLNNAAQAIAERRADPPSESDPDTREDVIRITLNHDQQALHLIVSDTGPGFRDPGRVFDAFYTTKQPGEGAGLGLNVCYGIVREHGGEITAVNLHPRGAAVIVELPVAKGAAPEETEQVLQATSA